MKDLRLFKDLNLHEATAGKTGRMIGFGALSLITGLYCAELCTAALLHVIGAVSLARLASSTIFIIGFAAVSLSWAGRFGDCIGRSVLVMTAIVRLRVRCG